MPSPIWTPSEPAFTAVETFRRAVNRRHNLSLKDYYDLYQYSVDNDTFWMDLWEQVGITHSKPPEKVRYTPSLITPESLSIPATYKVNAPGKSTHQLDWFPGARLNYAENLLVRRDDRIACTILNETGVVVDYSYLQLRGLVQKMAAAMKAHGLVSGDRVAAVLTNSINAVVIFLASASIGAIYTSTAPDMGATGILSRYTQVRPKLIFMETEVFYAGKVIDLREKCSQVISSLRANGLKEGILLPSRVSGTESHVPGSLNYSMFLASANDQPLAFEQLPFQHPLIILYSSGTTGTPKCITHSAGGILIQLKKELAYGYGLSPEGTFFQYTTTGWMMWVLLMGSLSWGARAVLYDGSPFHPGIRSFLKMISDQGATVAGLSPRFLSEMRANNIKPHDIASFESLQTLAVGGSILTANLHAWTQQVFGKSTRVFIGMGGTDICSAFVLSTPSLPVYAGEIPCKSLGIKVEVYDDGGRNIEHTGRAGEMVVTKGHPTVPLFFWGDDSGQKLHEAYFDMFPGVWRQGDFMVVNTETRGIQILGRSDGVLNPKGIRFGSGEIYSILEHLEGTSERIEDTICVGQRRAQDTDERVILFVKMRPGNTLTRAMKKQITTAIRKHLSARHVPDFIVEVESIPYTSNGKKIEVAVKQIVSGTRFKPNGAVANPESLEQYYKYQQDSELLRASDAKL
ncbi:hypothetical protein VNI00_012029 [Paramarasmius palmivorus]|uniref:Acetoacetyl-CoA synthetase n=1 Tax=Paramarasmius palmivorus TaxID=297713 RepID=A0AAW0C8X4_9AGAR